MLNRALLRRARSGWLGLSLTIGLCLAGGLLTVAQAWALSQIIAGAFLLAQGLDALTPKLAVLLGVMALRAVTAAGSEVAASHLAILVKGELRRALLQRLLRLGPAYAQGERTGELTATATESIEALEPYFAQYLPQLASAALVPVTILVFVTPLDWVSALVLALTAPLIPFFMVLIGKAVEALTRRQHTLLGRLSAHFLDVIQGLTTLKLLGQSGAQARAIGRVSDQYRAATLDVLRVAFLSALVLEIVATISTAIIAVAVALRLLAGTLSFQPALCLLILAPEFYLPLRMLGQRYHAAVAGATAAARIFEILDQPARSDQIPRPKAGLGMTHTGRPGMTQTGRPGMTHTGRPGMTQTGRLGMTPTDRLGMTQTGQPGMTPAERSALADVLDEHGSVELDGPIHFREVHYAYPGGRAALRGVSFDIHPGQMVALVGPSGAGKSTIANLLLRFAAPDQGEISVGLQSLGALALADWRSRVGWVPQTPHLFHDSLAANLRLARPDAAEADLRRAAEHAHLHDFIAGLPEGYATMIGERGARLSGGEAQRLALARAFLKDAPLLVMDEPASSVDPELEAQLQAATEALMRGRTVLLIAHRLATVARADLIIVLAEGRVAEAGRHAALLELGGLYRRLVESALEAG